MRTTKLNQLVAFAVLMENNGGILTKAPPYILEKFNLCGLSEDNGLLLQLLDGANQHKFREWLRIWLPDQSSQEKGEEG